MRHVGDLEQEILLTGLGCINFFPDFLNPLSDLANLRFDFATVFSVSLERTNFLGNAVPVSLKLLLLRLAGSTILVTDQNFID
jgi:hypothetical protein